MAVGRLLSYWEGNFSGAMLNFGMVSRTFFILHELTKVSFDSTGIGQQSFIEHNRTPKKKSRVKTGWFHIISGQTTIIPKPELRGFWGDSLTKPPFGVTSAEVAIICPEYLNGLYNVYI